MKSMLSSLVLVAVIWITLSAVPVLAACTDAPKPDAYWRRCVFDRGDLGGLDLSGASIRDSSFKRVNLADAVLAGVDARRAKFVSADMTGVILDEANLAKADLTRADLTGASLKGTDLTQARLFQANLTGADLSDARVDGADMLQAVFDGATWIDGITICAEGSVGRCKRSRVQPESQLDGDGPDVFETDAEPPA